MENLYSIKDKLVGYTGPLMFKDDKVAIRWFEQKCRQMKDTEYSDNKYYDLYLVGQFDPETGEIVTPKSHAPELIREGENVE